MVKKAPLEINLLTQARWAISSEAPVSRVSLYLDLIPHTWERRLAAQNFQSTSNQIVTYK